jgi:hypothetical protein
MVSSPWRQTLLLLNAIEIVYTQQSIDETKRIREGIEGEERRKEGGLAHAKE